MAITLYLIGFLLTEALIFFRGMAAWLGWSLFKDYSRFLALGSILIPIAVLLMLRQSMGKSAK
jgi:hypothetical protein